MILVAFLTRLIKNLTKMILVAFLMRLIKNMTKMTLDAFLMRSAQTLIFSVANFSIHKNTTKKMNLLRKPE